MFFFKEGDEAQKLKAYFQWNLTSVTEDVKERPRSFIIRFCDRKIEEQLYISFATEIRNYRIIIWKSAGAHTLLGGNGTEQLYSIHIVLILLVLPRLTNCAKTQISDRFIFNKKLIKNEERKGKEEAENCASSSEWSGVSAHNFDLMLQHSY